MSAATLHEELHLGEVWKLTKASAGELQKGLYMDDLIAPWLFLGQKGEDIAACRLVVGRRRRLKVSRGLSRQGSLSPWSGPAGWLSLGSDRRS
jgi:hypothetical protein